MEISERLKTLSKSRANIMREQDKLLQEYLAIIDNYASADLSAENESMRRELQEQRRKAAEYSEKYLFMEQENQRLRLSLHEQMLDEKLGMIKISRQKMNTYFNSITKQQDNLLAGMEKNAQSELEKLRLLADKKAGGEYRELLQKVEEANAAFKEKLREEREQFFKEKELLRAKADHEFDLLAREGLSEEQIQKRIKQNAMEMKIGLSWVNKLGIVMILFGVGTAAQYSYSSWFSGHMKGLSFFILGSILMAAGECYYRKGKQTFALGLIGGGTAVLYGAIFYSYFLLEVLSLYVGMLLSVLVTAAVVVLSIRYTSKTVCALGLVGGYLPFLSYASLYGINGDACYIAMGYLLLLNAVVLILALRYKWNVVNYISFVLQFPSLVYLLIQFVDARVGLAYTLLNFAAYLAVILVYPLRHRIGLNRTDITLLVFNTFISFIIVYQLFCDLGWDDYLGLAAVIFCLTFAGLAYLLEKKLPSEKRTLAFLNVTALSTALLIIPAQFGVHWWSMGWLAEGLLLLVYGRRQGIRSMEKAGKVMFVFCVVSFFAVDWLLYRFLGSFSDYFGYKYFAVTLSLIILLWQQPQKILFKYAVLTNLWLYLLYFSGSCYDFWQLHGRSEYIYRQLTVAILSFLMAYGLERIKLLWDKQLVFFTSCLYVAGIFIGIKINLGMPVIYAMMQPQAADYWAFCLLVFYNLLSILAFKEVMMAAVRNAKITFAAYSLLMVLFLLFLMTVFFSCQLSFPGSDLWLSLAYLFTAFSLIFYGFHRRMPYVRMQGLALTLLATAKMFFWDLELVSMLSKIAAYFSFGVIMLGISYMYQKLKTAAEEQKHEKKE